MLKDDLEGEFPFGSLLIHFFDLEVIQRKELLWVEVALLFGVKVDEPSVGKDTELFRPFI
jgi:hypothetical protein